MPEWTDDPSLFALMRRTLYTPVVGDILDQHGRFHQFLPPAVRPLLPTMQLAGRAMPVLQIDVFGHQAKPFGKMCQALDDLKNGEIYISTRGAVGAVVNGWHRDTPKVLEQNWPVFSRGTWAQDSGPRMQVVDFRCRIEIEGTVIEPGDVIFGDLDGVVVIPRDLVEPVITAALDKARGEKLVRREIENGMLTADAFAKYGIL